MSETVVFSASNIVTLDPNRPEATHVAVRDGMILAVGDADCAAPWGEFRRDDRFADAVLMPGFVEGHAHLMAGAMWNYAYAGYHDRIDPDGRLWKGKTDIGDVIAGLEECEAALDADTPLVAWGFDPIFLPTERLNRGHLDRVSATRPIAVIFSNFHLMCVNSVALEMAGYGPGTNAPGVILGDDGHPTGELQEVAAMFPVMRRLGIDLRSLAQREEAIRTFGRAACRAGVTTSTDLLSTMTEDDLDAALRVTGDDSFSLRLVPVLGVLGGRPEEIAERAVKFAASSTGKLRFGAVKIMTDGSIQGWTARVKWPGYVGGQPNGLWNAAPEQLGEFCDVMQRTGIQMHIHVNGDEAAEVAIDAIDAALREHPWQGHRHVLQHCQMMGRDQFARCAELGICVNIFANHIWYFGDQHAALTIGEERASRMDACRSALDAGVPVAIHSDAPVTPLAPLFTAWCAVNRRTMSGRVLGPEQRITVTEALRAITLGPAYTLKLDREIGSIEVGKRADFAVLGADPTKVDPAELRDVPVLGTVLGGVAHSP